MAADATRALLATTSLLFDKSDELCDETRRLVRASTSRRAPAEAAEVSRLAAAGIPTAQVAALSAAGAGADALSRALVEARAAAASAAGLQADRDSIIEARRAAIAQRETALGAARERVTEELRSAARCGRDWGTETEARAPQLSPSFDTPTSTTPLRSSTDASFVASLREIVAANASSV
jgi:hypothetical protein